MLTALAILGGVFAYTQIGRLVSNKAWEIRCKNQVSASTFLFFPFSSCVGLNKAQPLIDDFSSKRTYVLSSSLFWPARLIWSFLAWPSVGCVLILDGICDSKILRFCFHKARRALLFLGTPIYKIFRAAYLTLHEPEETLKGLGSSAKSIGKWLAGRKKMVALPEKIVEDALPAMYEELNGLLAEQEVVVSKIRETQEKICVEEARRMGTYREAPHITPYVRDEAPKLTG